MTDAAGKQCAGRCPSWPADWKVKQYANADRPVLNDISFDVPHGKVFVIVGPSGSGKSTLLRTIAGLEPIQGVIVGPSGSGKSTLLRTIAGLEPIQG
ncbi:ATP-binding cassette domain-containing protein, partial [Algiphilus sp. NNCM1]|nr:ATP-binding cassette domain-containing protein [Algiphilus acroporae]